MAQQWQIESAKGRCVVTDHQFEEGEEFYTALFEDGEGFRRVDYSLESWQSPPDDVFCYFKSRVPVKEKKKKVFVNDALIEGFFVRLAEESEPIRVQFRFVLALILMRKRKLRYDSSAVEDGVERWSMTLMSNKSSHVVVNPNLTDEQIDGVSQQLTAILHSDMGEWSEEPVGDGSEGGTAASESIESDVAEPNAAETVAAEPDSAEPVAAEPDVAESDAEEPVAEEVAGDAIEPDAIESDEEEDVPTTEEDAPTEEPEPEADGEAHP